jgi:alpha-1,3-rhamnosyl/mannosyltransferase
LVIAGAPGWKAGALERDLQALHRSGGVRFLGYTPPEDLPLLYAGAAAFVYPSLYEGFGLPPLEAMASGVPVLVSGRSALPEVVSDAGIIIDPDDAQGTASALQSLLQDPAQRAVLAARGRTRASTFTWERCARATMLAYQQALQ